MMVEELDDLKNEEVICYCRSGNRSGQACLISIHLDSRIPRILLVECWPGKRSLGRLVRSPQEKRES
jgi:hypothetical protein